MPLEREPLAPNDRDPYAPPPRHKDGSGKMVRALILAGILGLAGAGYALYADQIEEARNTPMVQEEQFADVGDAAAPVDSLPPVPADATEEPAEPSAAPATPPAPAPSASEPLPAPSTTTEPAPATGEPG